MIDIIGVAHNEVKSINKMYEFLEKKDYDCLVFEFSESDLPDKADIRDFNLYFLDNSNIQNPSFFLRIYNFIIERFVFLILLVLSPFIKFYVNWKVSGFFQNKNINDYRTVNLSEVTVGIDHGRYNDIDVYGIDYSPEDMKNLYLLDKRINYLNIPFITFSKSFKKYCLTGNFSRYYHLSNKVNEMREEKIIEELTKLDKNNQKIVCVLGEEHVDEVNKKLNEKGVDSDIVWRRFGKNILEDKPSFLKL